VSPVRINNKQPVAVALAPEEGLLKPMLDGMACREFDLFRTETAAELAIPSAESHPNMGAFVIDTSHLAEEMQSTMEALVDSVDAAFRDAGGPVIGIVDGDKPYDEGTLLAHGFSKIVDGRLGQRALRLVLSIEIEEFARLRLLRTELKKRSSAIGQIVQGQFRFKTRREAQNLATMLSMTCPNPMPIAIGLTELFINSVEHGCLDIGHDEKGRLIEDGLLAQEIERRRTMPEFCDRVVTVDFRREPNRLFFEVKDGGKGFDFKAYVANSEGHSKKHGRGIMMANGCFEELTYKGNGNEVHAVHYFGGRNAGTD